MSVQLARFQSVVWVGLMNSALVLGSCPCGACRDGGLIELQHCLFMETKPQPPTSRPRPRLSVVGLDSGRTGTLFSVFIPPPYLLTVPFTVPYTSTVQVVSNP